MAIEQANHSYAHIKHIDDLGKQFVRELEEFFVNYHALSSKKYRIIGVKGLKPAHKRTNEGMNAVKRKTA